MVNSLTNSKKGLTREVIASLIIGIVIILILLLFLSPFKTAVIDTNHKTQCTKSVRDAVGIHILGEPFGKEIVCPMLSQTIKDDSSVPKQEEKIKRIIANEMVDAWDIYGRGELKLFNEEDTFCAVYETFDFEKTKEPVRGFSKFLAEEYVPLQKVTYQKYFMPYANPIAKEVFATFDEKIAQPKLDIIDTKKKYAIYVLFSVKKDWFNELLQFAGLNIVETFKALAFGDKDAYVSFIIFDEYGNNALEKIGCSVLPVAQLSKPKDT